MNGSRSHPASPRGEPKRKRKDSPSRRAGKLAAKAEHIASSIQTLSRERQEGWALTERRDITERTTRDLERKYDEKVRLLAEAPQLTRADPLHEHRPRGPVTDAKLAVTGDGHAPV